MEPDAPQLLGPGEGETIRPGFEIKVGRPELVLTESTYAVGQRGPDPHVHHDHVDSFWVLEGELLVEIGPQLEPRTAAAGSFVLVPPDVLHSFHNPGPGEARFLNLHAPGLGFEEYLRSGFTAPFDQPYEPAGTGRPSSKGRSRSGLARTRSPRRRAATRWCRPATSTRSRTRARIRCAC